MNSRGKKITQMALSITNQKNCDDAVSIDEQSRNTPVGVIVNEPVVVPSCSGQSRRYSFSSDSDDSVVDQTYDPDSMDDITDSSSDLNVDLTRKKKIQTGTLDCEEAVRFPEIIISDKENIMGSTNTSIEKKHSNNSIQKRKVTRKTEIQQRGRRRVVHVNEWKCNKRKLCYAAGETYISKTGKTVAAREIKPPCSCRMKCFEKLTDSDRLDIFNNYWRANADHNVKRQFILSCVENRPTATMRRNVIKPKQNTLIYKFSVNNIPLKVCKTMFLNTLAISNSVVITALKKKQPGGIIEEDQRGRRIPVNKTSEVTIHNVTQHISSFPAYESHYSREQSERKFLSPDLNIEKMYQLYLRNCAEIFNTQFRLNFKPVQNDTCDICDSYCNQLKNPLLNPTEKDKLQKEYDAHLVDAEQRYNLKSVDKGIAKSNMKHKVLTADLQKCLPTPMLTCGLSFYKRKLWTFDFTIYDASDGTAHCIMWDESKAGRGGDEIASALLKWAEMVISNSDVEEITLWSDNCYGQNKNIMLITCFFWILHKWQQIKVINQKFLLKGHTHMEADTIHALIERKRKKVHNMTIQTPWDWQQFIRSCSPTLTVHNMELNDFKNFTPLYNKSTDNLHQEQTPFVYRKFPISECVHLQVRQENIGELYYKKAFHEDFKSINLKRRNATFPESLAISRIERKPISTAKYNDLMSLLPFVSSDFHDYYKSLPKAGQVSDFQD